MLDLGSRSPTDDTTRSQTISLVTTTGEHERYICLSHRWGSDMAPTTMKNITDRHQGLQLSTLPLKFQDAVYFTRRLGIRYLWIDSICIVQDDKEDWARESLNMYSIFEGSYLTIAAAVPERISKRLFAVAPPEKIGYRIEATTTSHPWEVFIRKPLVHTDPDLQKRGWVYQEFLASPRYLEFGSEELAWFCDELSTCECESDHLGFHRNKKVPLIYEHSPDHQMLRQKWHDVVSAYTEREFTYHSDRHAALAAIVKKFEEKLQDEYIAGAWRSQLIKDLCWSTRYPAEIAPDSTSPSWSWEALMASIEYRNQAPVTCSLKELITPIRDPLLLVITDPGILILNGLVLVTKLVNRRFKRTKGEFNELVEYGNDSLEIINPLIPTHMMNRVVTKLDFIDFGDNWDTSNPDSWEFRDPVYCFQMTTTSALILRCIDPDRLVYRRIGIFLKPPRLGMNNGNFGSRRDVVII